MSSRFKVVAALTALAAAALCVTGPAARAVATQRSGPEPVKGTLVAVRSDPPEVTRGVKSLAFGANDNTLAAGDGDGDAYLWDIKTGTFTATPVDHGTQGVAAVAFGLDGTLAICDVNGNVYLWDPALGKVTADLLNDGVLTPEAVGPGGTVLATADWSGFIYVWRLSTSPVQRSRVTGGTPGAVPTL
jgi:WD40 repeat protein